MVTTSKEKDINRILGISESYQAPGKIMEILYDRHRREKAFEYLKELHGWDLSYDWFHEYFQDEHADRAKKKQDFTPDSIGRTLAAIIQPGIGVYKEQACGTGGLVIKAWDESRKGKLPWEFNPSNYFYELEELSERTIPFLLINLMIRGVNASVLHCDTLTRRAYGAFYIQNYNNDALSYSDLNVLPYTAYTEQLLDITFTEQKYHEHAERILRLFKEE